MTDAEGDEMTRLQKAERFGQSVGCTMTLISVSIAALFIWLAIQAASAILAVILLVWFIYLFGGFFMDSSGSSLVKFVRELARIPDTRNRVHAMEEYHGIDYTVIPEKRLYVKHGERCELVVKRVSETA